MSDYIYSNKAKTAREEIELEKKKFSEISDSFPNAEIIRAGALKLTKNYEELLRLADSEIEESEDSIRSLNKENDKVSSELNDYETGEKTADKNPFKVKTLEDEMKIELFHAAIKKYTLVQLEERLGNKFQLI